MPLYSNIAGKQVGVQLLEPYIIQDPTGGTSPGDTGGYANVPVMQEGGDYLPVATPSPSVPGVELTGGGLEQLTNAPGVDTTTNPVTVIAQPEPGDIPTAAQRDYKLLVPVAIMILTGLRGKGLIFGSYTTLGASAAALYYLLKKKDNGQ